MTKIKSILRPLAVLLVILVLYLLLWPVPIDPIAWSPPLAPPLTGQYQSNSLLAQTERLSLGNDRASAGSGFGPEDVALDSAGRIYAGLDDGRIMRYKRWNTGPEFLQHEGRPRALVLIRW